MDIAIAQAIIPYKPYQITNSLLKLVNIYVRNTRQSYSSACVFKMACNSL